MRFFVFDRSYKEELEILLVRAGCHGYKLNDAIDNLKIVVSTLSLGSSWVPRSVLKKVVGQIIVDRDAVVGSSCPELFPRKHEVARWIGLELTNKQNANLLVLLQQHEAKTESLEDVRSVSLIIEQLFHVIF